MTSLSMEQGAAAAQQLYQMGKLAPAEQLCRNILANAPETLTAKAVLGQILCDQEQYETAAALLLTATSVPSPHPRALVALGKALWKIGQFAASAEATRQALTLEPHNPEAHRLLGIALYLQGQINEAITAYLQAVALKPDYAEAHANLAVAMQATGKVEQAITIFHKAIEFNPTLPAIHLNLGGALYSLGRYEEAIAACKQALILKPDLAEAYFNMGLAYYDLGRMEEAAASFRQTLALHPEDAKAHASLGLALLSLGQFKEGWAEYEWRRQGGLRNVAPRSFPQPEWHGEDFSGKTLLLYAEQGLGDTLQFMRFVPVVQARGGRVIVEVNPLLVSYLALHYGEDVIVPSGLPLPTFDIACPLLSLPFILGLEEADFAASGPYLQADPELAADWEVDLPAADVRVGIVWQGNPAFQGDGTRSLPVHFFIPLAYMPEVSLVSLQKHHGVGQSLTLPEELLTDLGEEFQEGDFQDTAAILASLDLVITADTSVAHLAGALGKPVWVLLPYVPDWRWMHTRSDSPWYPSMRLFRQKSPGDWGPVQAEVQEALVALIQKRSA